MQIFITLNNVYMRITQAKLYRFLFCTFQMMKNVIENPAEPISDASYFECLDGVMEKSKVRFAIYL